jgi:hypothetical protein
MRNKLKNARVGARREMILEKLFLPTSKRVVPTNSEGNARIWVDANFLRRFFSCHDGLEDIFQDASTAFLKSQSFLCEHSNGLHPRVARQGKLLRLDLYNELEHIMQEEYAVFLRDQGHDALLSSNLPLMDHKFVDSDGSSLICQDCGLAHQKEAKLKYDMFKVIYPFCFVFCIFPPLFSFTPSPNVDANIDSQ